MKAILVVDGKKYVGKEEWQANETIETFYNEINNYKSLMFEAEEGTIVMGSKMLERSYFIFV